MVFCNNYRKKGDVKYGIVTILILVDGFLQCGKGMSVNFYRQSHNPYFSRWFSAMYIMITLPNGYSESQSLF